MAIWTVSTSAGIYFGSGSASVSLYADGVRVQGNLNGGSNGFVSWTATELASLRNTKCIEYTESYYPGGTKKFKGSGRHFIKWAIEKGVASCDSPHHSRRNKNRITEEQRSPASMWVRKSRLYNLKISKIEATIPINPDIRGGKSVPEHFYANGYRWERFSRNNHVVNGEIFWNSPSINSDGLTSWGTLAIKRNGMWFEAPASVMKVFRTRF